MEVGTVGYRVVRLCLYCRTHHVFTFETIAQGAARRQIGNYMTVIRRAAYSMKKRPVLEQERPVVYQKTPTRSVSKEPCIYVL